MANIESWKLEEIQRTLELSLNSFLGITGLDSDKEIHRKSIENQSCITRMITNCLALLKDNDEDKLSKLDKLANEYVEEEHKYMRDVDWKVYNAFKAGYCKAIDE